MKTVNILIDWPDYPNVLRQSPNNDGIWDDFKFTINPAIDKSDYLLVINRPKTDINMICGEGNKWLLSWEPPSNYHKFSKKSYHYFDHIISQNKIEDDKHEQFQGALPWHINKSYSELISLPDNKADKQNKVSWITSNQGWMKGHAIRMRFINYLTKNKFPFTLYGRGFNEIEDKFTGLYPYKYSIAIENSYYNNYWTEKLADCFLSWTMPIYYGAPNIFDYFPKESMIWIDPNQPQKALQTINDAIDNNAWKKNLDAIKISRELILNKYQLFPLITNRLKQHPFSDKQTLINIPKIISPWEKEPGLLRKLEFKVRKILDLKPY